MKSICTIFGLLTIVICAHAQTAVVGNAVRIIDNRKDIYHDKNELHRKIMIKEAILEAIEKGADISIKNLISYNVESVSIDDYEQHFDNFVSKTLQEYHVTWKRTSQFTFSRDAKHKKKWHCRVTGEVINVDFEASEFDENDPSTINGAPSYSTSFYITRKSFGKVHINAGFKDGLRRGNKLIAYKYRNKKSLAGYNTVKKPKAHIYITEVGDDYALGEVVNGYYRQLKRNEVEYGIFNLNKGGLKYELFLQEEKLNLTRLGINKPVTMDITGHAFSFTHWSYLSKWGVEIGADLLGLRTSELSDVAINVKLGGYRNVTILPELLYLQPKIHLGYMFVNLGEELFDIHEEEIPLTFEAKIGTMLTLSSLDFSAGMSYRYVYAVGDLSNFYPYFGIGYNLYR
jgi:hypothetical protein